MSALLDLLRFGFGMESDDSKLNKSIFLVLFLFEEELSSFKLLFLIALIIISSSSSDPSNLETSVLLVAEEFVFSFIDPQLFNKLDSCV